MAYQSYNPYTKKLNRTFDFISDKQLINSLESSAKVFNDWKQSSMELRSEFLINLADILENEVENHAHTICSEMGKPINQAITEVKKSATLCRYYARETEKLLQPKYLETSGCSSKVIYQPQGTVFAIMPWNYPYWQVLRCFAPAVASGNCFLLKHASNVPLSASMLEDTILRSGFPKGLFQNLFLSHKQTAEVIMDNRVRTISLTGSNSAGEIIAARAGSVTKKCVLELGGSDPFIVFKDADLRKAAEAAITGRFQNNGQSCIAAKRLFIDTAIYDDFMSIFRELVSNLKVGDPMIPETDIGPLVDRNAVKELIRQVRESVEMGAEISYGKMESDHGDSFFDPMIIENAPEDSPVAEEETFGPVIPVFRFNDYTELLRLVNTSIFGLGSSVWSSDKATIEKVTNDIDAGMVAVNGFTRSDPALPFGGVKSSGYGRELSDMGLMEFLNIKTISVFH